ncbi:hypothetical protein DSC45_23000 [Streptomyces sp. YIM 130001]|uniref:hypothetical protein n=1 Tax=Streptomyces sp. YIM 130001 TaxID=2259644 RepID=UPI000E653A6E|nr:hypothetical protein [Streptomyces sp. YIM 130001]RII13826.1 hypothetical protein DSC45_23000 [Streptomyces sp. YIM 130001]
MAIKEDIRKTLSDPTPLYFAAGTADLAVQQARKVPELIEKIQAEAPGRIDAVRQTDPKDVQEKAAARAKEAQEQLQNRVGEVFGSFDTDLRKLGETAQDLALRGVGVAAEYVIKARETYEKVAEHGEQTVRTWRGEAADDIVEAAVVVEPEPKQVPVVEPRTETAPAKKAPAAAVTKSEAPAKKAEAPAAPAKKAPAKKPAAKRTTAKKSTPPAGK